MLDDRLKQSIYSFFESLKDSDQIEMIHFLNNVTEVSTLINYLKNIVPYKSIDPKTQIKPEIEDELKRIDSILNDKKLFPTNRFLISFIVRHFSDIIGNITLEKRSRNEIAKKLYSCFRERNPNASISDLIQKLSQTKGTSDYNDFFQAITKSK